MKLTEAEWDELVEAISDSEISARVLPIVEAIIAARLADVRALADEFRADADEWEATAIGPFGMDRGRFKAYRDSAARLRAVVDGQTPAQATEGEACTCGEFAGTSVTYTDCPVHGHPRPVMSNDFRFGDRDAREDVHGEGCCGKPTGCGIESRGCVHKPEKADWRAKAAKQIEKETEK